MNRAESNQAEEVAEHLFNFRGYQKMLWLLFFFGGPVGGLGYFVCGLIFSATRGGAGALAEMWGLLPWMVLMGWPLGVIPAVLTGLAAVLLRLVKGWRGSILMAVIGAAWSFVCGGFLLGWQDAGTLFAPAGALSALLFSIWLPKRGTVSRSCEAA